MNYFYSTLRLLTYLFAILLILAALFVSVGRLLTPLLNEHLPDFEKWSSSLLQTPVKINNVHISWNLYEPELSFDNVALLDKQAQHVVFSVQQIKVNLNIFHSLLAWKPIPETIKILGAKLTIHHLNGKYIIEEFKGLAAAKNVSGKPSDATEILGVVLAPANILLRDIQIIFHEQNKEIKSLNLNRLLLENSSNSHQLICDAILEDEESTQAHAEIRWQGNIENLSTVSAQVYFYLEGFSLAEWLGNLSWQHLQVKEGIGSAKIWGIWNSNHWQSAQTEFQIYDLAIESQLTKRLQKISRLNAHLSWRRMGNDQMLAGEDILIDLPEHLWPDNRFSITFTPTAEGSYLLKQINVNYLDVGDVRNLALKSGLLSAENTKKLEQFNPSGEISNLSATLPQGLVNDKNNSFSMQFNNVGFKALDSFPGLFGLKGRVDFSNNQADLRIDSRNVAILLPTILNKPLEFDYLKAHIIYQQQNKNWVVTANDVDALNADLKANLKVMLKSDGSKSPFIDLSSQFFINNVANISHYLPIKIFKHDLAQWLSTAFLKGQVTTATAIVHGNLSDFPFGEQNGTFLINGKIHNLDLAYAPRWPVLRNIDGNLVFSGNAMHLDVNGANIMDIPLSNIQADIPYIGSKQDSVLKIKGIIDADASQGMEFIHHSPLADTLGKDMAELHFSGPMKLNLNLDIPLDENKTKVNGEAQLNNVILNLPDWDMKINHLNGSVHFTEDTLKAKRLTGNLLGEDFILNLDTQTGEDAYIKANMQSKLSIENLEKWLHISLDKYVRGIASYQAEFHLRSHDHPVELILNSNLQGIDVLLPDPLGKNANEMRDTRFSMELLSDHKINSLVRYGDIASAALQLEKNNHALKFISGELNLNATEAQIPSKAGLVINAKFEKIDLPLLQKYYEWAKKSLPLDENGNGDLLRSIRLESNKADLFGQQLDHVKLQLNKNNKNWLVKIDSKQITGDTVIAMDFSQIKGRFQRLYLKSSTDQTTNIDPITLPAINLTANDVRYNNNIIGSLFLVTSPSLKGLVIKQLRAGPPGVNLQATGSWDMENHKSFSHLAGSFSTSALNQFLTQWDLNISSLIANNASANFDLYWEGAPYQPSLTTLSGSLGMQIRQGRIVNLSGSTEAKMGFGRMLSVLSLQTIPRRLSLDFSDLFQNGYSFDAMNGMFKFERGNAYTSDTRLDGPVARIDIAGRIGLQARDYDLRIGLTTYVTSSLVPAAVAAVTLVHPLVAAATLAVGAIATQTPGLKSSTYQYSITGTWDSPSWQQVGSSPVRTIAR